ncbi:MAG: cob(I)yrinic acid a,c-diamide adenosyltransferase [Patescibacteria group bacterium]
MAIYTRTGDKGQTSLFNGQRVSKADLRVEAYGTVDELNSVIGLMVAEMSFPRKRESKIGDDGFENELIKIQNDLFEIGSTLANPEVSSQKLAVSSLPKRVKVFEDSIDKMTEQMPALSNFILPGGGPIGAMLHFARTVSRRAERRVVALDERKKVDKNIIMYLNRLSDLLFTMARFVNYKEKQKEVIWVKI